ncbi:L-2-hydroxyglutarate oxidase LhgO [Microbulbifer donghaiensis]|uniref:L-2-hydroxyglutarate oxidase LhgO n=1 Tax=Microbulbifer donghaiensis TaxID=494016 RepID=A0A1M4U9A9_9GAMM|nr:NAD(P)/FAD-dependent oxidoreductase [Microbulbifer donghaiensis]SHE53305.1 L-2-hydroxyglutarate oxidase LhgO [Microbulbifer donghaiensis]
MDFDAIILGAGVIGLATARQLALAGRSVLVLEQFARPGTETSSRNSEVIHAGIYYPRNSLKARLCVRGRELLYRYCDAHSVSYRRTGKLIVATSPDQRPALAKILAQGHANGVSDLKLIDRQCLSELEPNLNAIEALYSPSTGIIDSHGLMLALQGDLEAHGGLVCCNSPVTGLKRRRDGCFYVEVGGVDPTTVSCRLLINSAGHGAQTLSRLLQGGDAQGIPPVFLSKGCYFTVSRRLPFSHLIYPLPSNEGLGVHLTLDLAGNARFGPDTEWVDRLDYRVDPARSAAFYQAIRAYYPDLRDGELVPDYAGIRPKVAGPGEGPGDFMIVNQRTHGILNYIALYGIESPGLTSCLAIAEEVCARLRCHEKECSLPNSPITKQQADYENSNHR